MDKNSWDEITLDEYLIPRLSEKQKEMLKEARFLGKYVVDGKMVCHRTQIVLRMLVLPVGRWRRFVSGNDDGEKDQDAVNEVLKRVLEEYRADVQARLGEVEESDVGMECQRDTLRRRWEQIDRLLQKALDRIG
jgi:hypothetical protein